MASTFPTVKLFANNGTTLIYNFENVLNWGDGIFFDPETFTEHISLRGQGSIISEGSTAPWDLELEFYLSADGYEALIALMKSVKDTILFNTQYILSVQLTSGGSTETLYVKRLNPIRYPITTNKKVTQSQRGFITFRVNTWV